MVSALGIQYRLPWLRGQGHFGAPRALSLLPAVWALLLSACVAETTILEETSGCVPECAGRVCGDNGCGGLCAPGCREGLLCDAGVCVEQCEGSCASRGCECGEVCGQSCGSCTYGSCEGCRCACIPECAGKTCGADGCGGTCAPGCEASERCVEGQCVDECALSCEQLGCDCDSVCGESCGVCEEGVSCLDCQCRCVQSCEAKQCGDDGCGGSCAPGCAEHERCSDGRCLVECLDSCALQGCECGEVCGESCGVCADDASCDGCRCGEVCLPNCAGRECGADGCGGQCSPGCSVSQSCEQGRCEPPCQDTCESLDCVCGIVCGQSCGACSSGSCDGCRCVQGSDLIRIPAAGDTTVFAMGCPPTPTDGWCESNNVPAHAVTLSAFEIDRYEVTAAQYDDCVVAGACTTPGTGSSSTFGVTGKEDHPVNYVSWQQASAYCQWRGMRLPTEAEWERAAKGTIHRRFSWGDDCPSIFEAAFCLEANWDGGSAKANCHATRCFDAFAETAPVGSFAAGVSSDGVHDLAGNVFEWVADWYSATYYENSPASDPLGPETGTQRVARGGSWNNYGQALRSTLRNSYSPSNQASNLGFRCAR